jgi:hypothetical protein
VQQHWATRLVDVQCHAHGGVVLFQCFRSAGARP